MLSDFILMAVLIVLASIFLTMIYVAWSKQCSKGDNRFLLVAGSAFALLGLVFVYVGVAAMVGQWPPGLVILLVGLFVTPVSVILAFKARGSLRM
jgi:hypothetical protein